MKENTEIRAANENKIVQNLRIKEDSHWEEIKFDYNDFPSYTELANGLLSQIKQ